MLSEDLALFFQHCEFAVTARWKQTHLIKGLFENAYVEVQQVESTAPAFICAASEVPGIQQRDELIIHDERYRIVNVRPDGTGLVTLILELQ